MGEHRVLPCVDLRRLSNPPPGTGEKKSPPGSWAGTQTCGFTVRWYRPMNPMERVPRPAPESDHETDTRQTVKQTSSVPASTIASQAPR